MPKRVAAIISPNYKDYAKKYLADCYASLKSQDYSGEIKIFITDNESNRESYEFLQKMIPEAIIHCNQTNDGFAKGNNDSIQRALKQGFDYIVLFNMDTEVALNCVSELIKAAETNDKIGAVQARLMLHHQKTLVNSLGNTTHFLGFGYSLGYKEKFKIQNSLQFGGQAKFKIQNIHYPSGAGVLFTRECLKKVGLYDEEYWMYNEDQEHGWRIWLAGLSCVLAPAAVVYHKYEFARSIKQYYYLDRNRIITILKCYHAATLLLIFPGFIVMELGLILFSIKSGWFKEKIRVWQFFLKPDTWKYLCQARRDVQAGRRVKDREIAKLITGLIWYQEIDDWKLKAINPVFDFYWKICQYIIIW